MLLGPWTLTEVAQRTAVPLSTVSDIINGRVNPTFDHAMAIAKALGITAEVLHRQLTEMRQERASARERQEADQWQQRRDAIERLIAESGGQTGKDSGRSKNEQAFATLAAFAWGKTRLVDKPGGSRPAAAPEPSNPHPLVRSVHFDRGPRRT
jgi:plasmid maintenance system antidote protein VapI